MLVIYFIATVFGFYVSALWRPGSVSIGASAALFGLVGAMVAVGMRYRSAAGDMIRSIYMRYLVYLLLFSLIPGIDMAAHIGGLIGGFGIAYIAGRPGHPGSPVERIWQVGAGLAVLTTLASFTLWYLWFRSYTQYTGA